MSKHHFAIALAIAAGIATVSIHAQAPGRGAPAPPPSVSKRGNRQIGSSASNLLGTRVGFSANAFGPISFSEAAAKVDALGAGYLEAAGSQKVSPEIPKNLDYNLSADEVAKVKYRLAELRLRLLAYRVGSIPADESSRRRLFTFAKAVEIETIVTSAAPVALPELDRLAAEFGINVAFESSDPKTLMSSLEGLSSRIGVSADTAGWAQAGIQPVEGLRLVNGRLLSVHLPDAATGAEQVLFEWAKVNPLGAPPPITCGDCSPARATVRPLFVTIPPSAAEAGAFEKAARRAEGFQVVQISKKTPVSDGKIGPVSAGSPNVSDGGIPTLDRWMIRDASPKQALVKPKKARKLLIIDLCPQGGFFHRTIPHANLGLELMSKNTGAFEAIFNNDLDNLKYPKIKDYDAIFLNSVVGSVFSDPDVISGLIRFVREGGGLAAIHGSTFASTDVPEYGELLGATTAPHRAFDVATLKMDDLNSPITKHFEGHDVPSYIDELYHFPPNGPYSREKLHVLMSINMAKSPPRGAQGVRPDNDYGLVWIKSFGNGRVFNCALGHSVLLFGTPQMAQLILNGIQFVLGDLEADTTPSAKLSTKQ
jgi:type 1 glutamine amidotransferase/sugar phosphate isomerase/epimerase